MLAATEEALNNAQWIPKNREDLVRTGVYVGSMNSNLSKMGEHISAAAVKGFSQINRLMMLNVLTNMGTANISVKYGFQGPSGTSSTACATGATAIGEAFRLIQLDEADVMVAGGSDEVVNPICVYSAIK